MRRDALADGQVHDSVIGELAEGAFRLAMRHRRLVFSALAGFAIVTYTTANALFLQDGAHPSAFFETREMSDDRRFALRADEAVSAAEDGTSTGVTRIVFDAGEDDQGQQVLPPPAPRQRPSSEQAVAERPAETIVAAPQPGAGAEDPIVELQSMLAALGFYNSSVDGLKGPQTRAAVEAYKNSVGLRGIDLSVDELLTSLRNNMMVTAAIPDRRPETVEPVPIPAVTPAPQSDRRIGASVQAPVADPMVLRVQAGLRAFGNEHIQVDGVAGEQTRLAIREFQTLFRLPATGEIDTDLVEKMAAVGLID